MDAQVSQAKDAQERLAEILAMQDTYTDIGG